MTASYATIPADVDSSAEPLLNKPAKMSLKRIFVAAAVTSFALGVVAATALSPASGTPAKIEFPLVDGACSDAWAVEPKCDHDGGSYRDEKGHIKRKNRPGAVMDSLACTPYGYAPHPYDEKVWEDNGWVLENDDFARIMLLGHGEKQGAWGTWDQDEFFVFHGSDGSGVQSDCVGDNADYIERFGKPAHGNKNGEDPEKLLDKDGKIKKWKEGADFNDVMPPGGFCWEEDLHDAGYDGSRNYCHMGHPGTKTFYEDYFAGWGNTPLNQVNGNARLVNWWDPTDDGQNCGDMGSANSGCWHWDYINKITDEIGWQQSHYWDTYKDKAISFMLLPWVCAEGAETPGENIFSWPTIANNNWKCYADNEVEAGYPPFLNYYYGYFDDGGTPENPENFRLYLNLRQWGPDKELTSERYGEIGKEKEFFPVMSDFNDYVW